MPWKTSSREVVYRFSTTFELHDLLKTTDFLIVGSYAILAVLAYWLGARERTEIQGGLTVTGIGSQISDTKVEPKWADLEMTFVYDSIGVPQRKSFFQKDDPTCLPEAMMPLSESLLVDPVSKGIKNVAIFLDTKNPGIAPSDMHPDRMIRPDEPAVLDTTNCKFEPHVLIARVGQGLKLLNSDSFGHNPNISLFANPSEIHLQPPFQSIDVELNQGEPAPMPICCNIHSWMRAYVLVFDHPYTGISDEYGRICIEKLPANRPITFRVWHESINRSIDSVIVQGQSVFWPKGRVTLTLAPGKNNLGIIKIAPTLFREK